MELKQAWSWSVKPCYGSRFPALKIPGRGPRTMSGLDLFLRAAEPVEGVR